MNGQLIQNSGSGSNQASHTVNYLDVFCSVPGLLSLNLFLTVETSILSHFALQITQSSIFQLHDPKRNKNSKSDQNVIDNK